MLIDLLLGIIILILLAQLLTQIAKSPRIAMSNGGQIPTWMVWEWMQIKTRMDSLMGGTYAN